ncbi:MAG: hydrogenase formation protein HypD [Candidatus Kariarchaeaceae archaeon]
MTNPSVPFRNRQLVEKLIEKIEAILPEKGVTICHVCGTHENAIARWGLRSLLPKNLQVIAGPGCPVCICPAVDVQEAIWLAKEIGVILCTFGDMMRVPVEDTSLNRAKAEGADIRVVYGAADAVKIAQENPDREIVFLSVGFETTVPMTAVTLLQNPPDNYSVLSVNRLVPPALEALASQEDLQLDGFIMPGHVSVIIGMEPYHEFTKKYNIANSVGGFEPIDILLSIMNIIEQTKLETKYAHNGYPRAVPDDGNKKAREILNEVYDVIDASWRGLGVIPKSGLELSSKFDKYNARKKFSIPKFNVRDIPPGCLCHLVIMGKKKPTDCPLFMKKCFPENPIGPCMVSEEGTCMIYAKYGGLSIDSLNVD